jgi:hypothetical protein
MKNRKVDIEESRARHLTSLLFVAHPVSEKLDDEEIIDQNDSSSFYLTLEDQERLIKLKPMIDSVHSFTIVHFENVFDGAFELLDLVQQDFSMFAPSRKKSVMVESLPVAPHVDNRELVQMIKSVKRITSLDRRSSSLKDDKHSHRIWVSNTRKDSLGPKVSNMAESSQISEQKTKHLKNIYSVKVSAPGESRHSNEFQKKSPSKLLVKSSSRRKTMFNDLEAEEFLRNKKLEELSRENLFKINFQRHKLLTRSKTILDLPVNSNGQPQEEIFRVNEDPHQHTAYNKRQNVMAIRAVK